jgi:16S rRNA (uracil1498-N3)-methyltransferase
MRVHRFYTGPDLKLKQDFWLHDEAMLWQWNKVLRFKPGQEVALFDGVKTDRLYKVAELSKKEAHLQMITELKRVMPPRHVYLFWSLLKKDHNDFVIQKCTELGVSNFVPIISDRSVKTGLNMARAKKILIEASEQCGRSTVPFIREPVHLQKVIEEYKGKIELYICHKDSENEPDLSKKPVGVFVGPEGGWSEQEFELFEAGGFRHINLSLHTLRAETAAVVAVTKLI